MITATISNSISSLQLPSIEKDFINTPDENAADVETLDGSLYTDFVGHKYTWTFNYDSLTQEQYDAIRVFYDTQFTEYQFPLLTIPFYSVSDQPVRMYINEKKIWNNCGAIENVQLKFRQTPQLPEVS